MKIQKVNTEDLKNLSTLAIQVWLDTYAIEGIRNEYSNYIWSELTPDSFWQRMHNTQKEFYKLVENEHLIGFLEINCNSSCAADNKINFEIEKLYIQNNFSGKGYGSEVIGFIDKLCKEKSINSFWLSVYEHNIPAIKFYKKNNFTEIGELYFELGTEKHRNLILKRIVV